ncbi:MAG: PucR family transcriptional regulator [Eubacteriaceae bacterium]
MKLSMWMIVNRLNDYEIEIDIKKNAEPLLKSVRLIPVEHCVYLKQKDNNVICIGENDKIILHNMDIQNAFEIVADVFDFYDDWDCKMREYAEKFNYEIMINMCWTIFNNPIFFAGNNKKVLAISEQYGLDDVNDEWRYIRSYGYVSIESIQKSLDITPSYYKSHICRHNSPKILDYITSPVIYDNIACGRIVVIEKDRKINVGDEQLVNHLALIIAPSMQRLNSNQKALSGHNTLFKLLKNYWVSIDEIDMFLKYQNWTNNDILRVCVLTPKPEYTLIDNILSLVQENCLKLLPEYPIVIFQNQVIIVFNESIVPYLKAVKHLKSSIIQKYVFTSMSLPFTELRYIKFYWQQAISVVKYGKIYKQKAHFFDFYDYALDYIIDSGIEEETIFACHPDIMEMHKNNPNSIITITAYLNNKCSLLHTANELFIHRNTLVYRIKKIIDELRYNINDSYTRDYMSLSIRILSLYERKKKSNHSL